MSANTDKTLLCLVREGPAFDPKDAELSALRQRIANQDRALVDAYTKIAKLEIRNRELEGK